MSALQLFVLLTSLCLNICAQADSWKQEHGSSEELRSMVRNLMTDGGALRKGLARSLKNNEGKRESPITDGSLAPRNMSWFEEHFKRLEKKIDILTSEFRESTRKPRDCADLYKLGHRVNTVYNVYPNGRSFIKVTCDMRTDGGGWTVFQKRYNGRVFFYRTWGDYAKGFGTAAGEYWLGLRNIHNFTQGRDMELYVILTTYQRPRYAKYGRFSVSSEEDKFELHVGNYSGNAGDSLSIQNNQKFSTKDQDNDKHTGKSCSVEYHGGWWYNRCALSNLNGQYYAGKNNFNHNSNYWYDISKKYEALKGSKMMMRPAGF